jgi:TRAP-type uncharacterized transport system fused permease subunit
MHFDLAMDSRPLIVSGLIQGLGVGLIFVPMSALAFASASLGIIALAASFHGYLLAVLRMWERVVLFVAALCLIAPEVVSSLIGLVLLGGIAAVQLGARRTAAATAPRAE